MRYDHKRWKDLSRDLGPVHRQQCSEHCLLKGWVHHLYFLISYFILDLFIFKSAWLCPHTTSCHHAYALTSAWLCPSLCFVIMLTTMCYSCLLLRLALFLNGLSTFSWVHLIISRHVIILSQGMLSFIYFLMRSLSPLCYYSLHLISMLCMAMLSSFLFHSDASHITRVHASILYTVYFNSCTRA